MSGSALQYWGEGGRSVGPSLVYIQYIRTRYICTQCTYDTNCVHNIHTLEIFVYTLCSLTRWRAEIWAQKRWCTLRCFCYCCCFWWTGILLNIVSLLYFFTQKKVHKFQLVDFICFNKKLSIVDFYVHFVKWHLNSVLTKENLGLRQRGAVILRGFNETSRTKSMVSMGIHCPM